MAGSASRFAGRPRNGMAFGVDPRRREFFSLRQARYDRLAEAVTEIAAGIAAREGRKARLLDIGPWDGVLLRHLEAHDGIRHVEYTLADLALRDDFHGREHVAAMFFGDLQQGYPEIASDAYDIVVCEQVIEHLAETTVAVKTLERVARPGGWVIIGVPTFPPPLHHVRRIGQPVWDRWFPPGKVRGHLQTFSAGSFKALVRNHTRLKLADIRGFRIFSGGPFAPLEEKEWWWRFAMATGRAMPWACVEVQSIWRKPG